MRHITSKLIHGSSGKEDQQYRSLKTPIYQTASYDFESAEDAEKAFRGESEAYIYSRIGNPTVTELEKRLALFSNADNALCVSSGMAAVSNVFLTLCSSGDNIITSPYLFGNTWSFFAKTLKEFNVEVRFVDLENPEEIERNIDRNTRAIFMEVLTNPQLIVYDFEAISHIASDKNIPLIADNSVLTPYIFESKNLGVDIEIFSNTKFISGGATSIGGTILCYPSDKWAAVPKLAEQYDKFGQQAFYKRMHKEIYRNTGACLSPNSAFLQLLGLETITLRIDRICENALKTAEFLNDSDKVQHVDYPALKGAKYCDLTQKFLKGKSGCLINLELDGKENCFRFMNNLEMIRRGTNFCDNKSMIIHPASTIFWDTPAKEKELMKINDNMLRLSVGLEDVSDIIDDIQQALYKL
ncbi:PLP-dependent transferase [Alkalitalea saponilacus]|uniref:O-acetylhomoserine (Thiol)-lyase n=1 Tax=Alkalitalea saponilacus TaxID=889453 RepID=A0A1T5HKV9_9BACT|nr:PLP-dependent transferase [Alkalitalea saponilacus]ASB47792.1 O-acetylhomoserine sulfhydrylase [Alkalitalea saponilacus]SKC21276.1 O-acetylhomoserine (thiol)-lyase [Alkalitalea saponilacus]